MFKIEDILTRQDIIKYFEQNLEIVQKLTSSLKGIPDLEKLVSSIHVSGIKLPSDHPEQRAIYYEQATYAKNKVAKLLLTLESFDKLQTLFNELIIDAEDGQANAFKKTILQSFPDMSKELQFFKEAFDPTVAESTGKIVPKKGVDEVNILDM